MQVSWFFEKNSVHLYIVCQILVLNVVNTIVTYMEGNIRKDRLFILQRFVRYNLCAIYLKISLVAKSEFLRVLRFPPPIKLTAMI